MDDEVLKVMQSAVRSVWAVNIDAYPAYDAWSEAYPGFGDLNLGAGSSDHQEDLDEPYIFHFPDGNASIARLLVRKMIPAVASGDNMEDIVTARFDYGQLDNPQSPVRIRLNSTVVRAQHAGNNLSNPVKKTCLRRHLKPLSEKFGSSCPEYSRPEVLMQHGTSLQSLSTGGHMDMLTGMTRSLVKSPSTRIHGPKKNVTG
jgi:hypothetical protein